MAFTSKSFTLARLLVLALLCWACIHPMVSLATPTQEETATFNALKAKAESGNAQAQLKLGEAYEFGNGVKKNANLAVIWYQKAALKPCAYAQYSLASLYANQKKYKDAFYWADKAAKAGSANGQVSLGVRYAMGDGIPKDYSKALYWFNKASEQGYYWGSFYAGALYKNGHGVPKNTEKAFEYYEKYALQGDWAHKDILGNMYLKEGGFLNFLKGWYWKASSIVNFVSDLATGKGPIHPPFESGC